MMGKFVPVVKTIYSTNSSKRSTKSTGFTSRYTVKSSKSEINCTSRPVEKRFKSRLITK